jgi:hypothetical protein
VIYPKNRISFEFNFAGNLFPFLVNLNLDFFFHLWQFQILNLIIVINYYDSWEEF